MACQTTFWGRKRQHVEYCLFDNSNSHSSTSIAITHSISRWWWWVDDQTS